ncbi:MAG: tetratricopeptide repeat protein, partial [Kofleriaceae bacterium]|nr:tetratricopeptide repeat protein [Kofleriaceae bacterium]
YAAARAAELDPSRGAELWSQVLALDPGDDYAAAQLRTSYVAAEATQLAIEVDVSVAADPERERARLRAAFGMVAQGQLDDAIAVLQQGHADRPTSLALAEALAEALAAAGRWGDRAKLLAEMAAEPGEQLDRNVAQLRSALAWEEAVGAAASVENPDPDEVQRTTAAALGAWEKVIEQAQSPAPGAHAAAIVLATRLGDKDITSEVLARAQAAERSPWGSSSLALRRARMIATEDAGRADTILGEAQPQLDDPRRTVARLLAAARRDDLADAATTLEERAALLGEKPEAAALRLRAAQLALDAGDAIRATALLRRVEKALPGVSIISDLLNTARRRAGDASGPVRVPNMGGGPASPDEFARVIRDADEAAANNDGVTALTLYQSALEMRPGDPLATVPLVRIATQLREPGPIAALALAQLRAAETSGDNQAKAEAYELLATIDKELRDDPGSAQIALESASQADPTRVDLMHRLEREYTVGDQLGELLRLRRAELEQIPAELAKERAAVLMDTAVLSERDQRPDAELTELYRETLANDPGRRIALLKLEAIVRQGGASEELAKLEEQIAAYFEGDARAQAAFFTRAGETLAELGQIDAAVEKFGKAEQVMPGHVPALEGWRAAALKGQLWIDVAEAATRQASVGGDADTRAALHHFAGVVLMDKALVGDQAMAAFRRALEANPSHRDSFMRMRILLEEDANHDELAILLANRLEHEPPSREKIEIHRALAELSRNFLGDREGAKKNYREILASDPNDLRAHAAIADIAWEQGLWQEAADALVWRARLERDPEILKTLCFRLGLIYADRIVDVPMALKAFQRALTYQPDDEATLVRLADLATQAGEWKLALGACERLVKAEQDPDKRAAHLHRVARIFRQGFGDQKRAERALNLALDNAPTNDDALSELVKFYRDAGDMTSVRVHLNRVAGTMRVRAANQPKDGVAYRVISRAMTARAAVGVDGSLPIARAAAELATVLGAAGEPERLLLAEPGRIDLAPLLRPDSDEVLFPRTVQTELRQIFTLLGDRVAKHVGVDLRTYGVGRGDRLRAKDSSVASHAQDVATGLGFGEIDVYVSARQPYAMVAEPTSPVSLVIGQAIAQTDARAIRFAAGSALKLAQAHLAIPARLSADEVGVLIIALLRMAQPEFPNRGLDDAAIAAQIQKLKRLIPTGLAQELKPFALAIDPIGFDHVAVSRDLRVAGLRAGLVAAGSLVGGLGILAAREGTDVPSFLADPVAQGLVSFALSEDHAAVTR